MKEKDIFQDLFGRLDDLKNTIENIEEQQKTFKTNTREEFQKNLLVFLKEKYEKKYFKFFPNLTNQKIDSDDDFDIFEKLENFTVYSKVDSIIDMSFEYFGYADEHEPYINDLGSVSSDLYSFAFDGLAITINDSSLEFKVSDVSSITINNIGHNYYTEKFNIIEITKEEFETKINEFFSNVNKFISKQLKK